mmetsp:Transcript_92990/g.240265  ORF Transcript_92990/g.240265 Transcript_92990/m.240265 type:complete len:301 (+) Transcript_92990:2260-3162(+)
MRRKSRSTCLRLAFTPTCWNMRVRAPRVILPWPMGSAYLKASTISNCRPALRRLLPFFCLLSILAGLGVDTDTSRMRIASSSAASSSAPSWSFIILVAFTSMKALSDFVPSSSTSPFHGVMSSTRLALPMLSSPCIGSASNTSKIRVSPSSYSVSTARKFHSGFRLLSTSSDRISVSGLPSICTVMYGSEMSPGTHSMFARCLAAFTEMTSGPMLDSSCVVEGAMVLDTSLWIAVAVVAKVLCDVVVGASVVGAASSEPSWQLRIPLCRPSTAMQCPSWHLYSRMSACPCDSGVVRLLHE